MRRYLYIIVAIIAISCEKIERPTDNIPPRPDTTPQTTIMYMTGTDLSYFFSQNISAAKRAISEDALGFGRFLVFKHTTSTTGSLMEISLSEGVCKEKVIKEYDDIVSLTPEALTTILSDAMNEAPADKYNLIISGHGTGWVLKEYPPAMWKASSEHKVPSIWEPDYANHSIITRYMGSSRDSYLDISELREGLEELDTQFHSIIFDECFMSSIELLYELRNLAEYIVASPCEIMGNGFPYDKVLPHLFANYGLDCDLGGVCQSFHDYYTNYSYPSGCIALTVCSELDALADITRQIVDNAEDMTIDTSALQVYERLENHIFFDLEQYMLAMCADDTALRERYVEQFDKTFPKESRLHTEKFFANIGVGASSANNYEAYYTTVKYYSGVTTSAPSNSFREDWQQTLWAKATNN